MDGQYIRHKCEHCGKEEVIFVDTLTLLEQPKDSKEPLPKGWNTLFDTKTGVWLEYCSFSCCEADNSLEAAFDDFFGLWNRERKR